MSDQEPADAEAAAPTARPQRGAASRRGATPGGLPADLTDAVLTALPDPHAPAPPQAVSGRPRVGLVLGAGGVLGNAYLAGVVAALHTLTGFEPRSAHTIVGTSAGAVHAALYGAGMPALFPLWRARGGVLPEAYIRESAGFHHADDAPLIDEGEDQALREIFAPARALPKLGPASKTLAAKAALRPWAYRPEVIASAWLPEGVLTNAAIGRALRHLVPTGWARHPRTWVTAVNLRTGHREVFGRPGAPRAHLDRAVRASCAIPGLYRPVRIGRDRYVDGGVHSPSNADLLAELDIDLAVVVNPMSTLEGHAASGFVDRYLSPLRRFAGGRLNRELRVLAERGVPVLTIQPTAEDLAVFSRNLMDPRPRRAVAERAVETTAATLSTPAHRDALTLLRVRARAAVR